MRRDRELERALRELEVPDEAGAEERAWDVIRAAHAERTPVHPSRRTRRAGVAIGVGVVALAIGLSPAGAKMGEFVSDVVGIGEDDARPALRSLPAAGELLVESEQGVWIVREDGSKRLLGDYEQAAWSPSGVYVAVTKGRELIAVDTDGEVRWTLPTPGVVHDARWVGSDVDTRIAYRSDHDLRVVAGDGDPADDHVIARGVAPVAPAWRPIGESKLDPGLGVRPYVLTYIDGKGKIRTVNADTGEPVPAMRADLDRLSTPPSGGSAKRALSPDREQLATIQRVGRRDRLTLQRRVAGTKKLLFSARGPLTGPTWSPDGRWLLVGWPAADQWLFIAADRPNRVVAFDRISEQFDPGGDGDGAFPQVAGWILPQR